MNEIRLPHEGSPPPPTAGGAGAAAGGVGGASEGWRSSPCVTRLLRACKSWRRPVALACCSASLFSIEVDYYKFGTCEMAGGSYFCGDHSCNTFKYVGERVHGATGKTVFEMPATGANVAKLVADTSPGATPGAKKITTGPYMPIGGRSHGTKDDSPIYTDGTGNTDGNRAPAGYVANGQPGTIHSQFVQTDQHGYPLRADAAEPQYHLYDGTKATEAAVSAASGGMATVEDRKSVV